VERKEEGKGEGRERKGREGGSREKCEASGRKVASPPLGASVDIA